MGHAESHRIVSPHEVAETVGQPLVMKMCFAPNIALFLSHDPPPIPPATPRATNSSDPPRSSLLQPTTPPHRSKYRHFFLSFSRSPQPAAFNSQIVNDSSHHLADSGLQATRCIITVRGATFGVTSLTLLIKIHPLPTMLAQTDNTLTRQSALLMLTLLVLAMN